MSTSVDRYAEGERSVFQNVPHHRQLTLGWGRAIALGWLLEMVALICVGASSQIVGRPVVWLDDQRWSVATLTLLASLACLPLMVTAVWSILRGPWVGYLSLIATIDLVLLAVLDRHNSPGSAVVTSALGVAAMFLTFGAFAGRYRSSKVASSVTASS